MQETPTQFIMSLALTRGWTIVLDARETLRESTGEVATFTEEEQRLIEMGMSAGIVAATEVYHQSGMLRIES